MAAVRSHEVTLLLALCNRQKERLSLECQPLWESLYFTTGDALESKIRRVFGGGDTFIVPDRLTARFSPGLGKGGSGKPLPTVV